MIFESRRFSLVDAGRPSVVCFQSAADEVDGTGESTPVAKRGGGRSGPGAGLGVTSPVLGEFRIIAFPFMSGDTAGH